MPSASDLAWAAGLFDGEGCIHIGRDYLLTVKVAMVHLPTVERFAQLVGCGTVRPGSERRPAKRTIWTWRVSASKAQGVIEALLPHLVTKRDEALMAIAFRKLPRSVGVALSTERRETLESARTALSVAKQYEWSRIDRKAA